MIVPDANLLIYAYNKSADEHAASREWLTDMLSGTESVGFCWQTITAFLRLSTNSKIFDEAYTPAQAIEIVENWLSSAVAHIVVPTERHLSILNDISTDGQVSGPGLMDAHLAALAVEHGATLATTDRDFRRFDGVKLIYPLDSQK